LVYSPISALKRLEKLAFYHPEAAEPLWISPSPHKKYVFEAHFKMLMGLQTNGISREKLY
jgi:hypothetical protein